MKLINSESLEIKKSKFISYRYEIEDTSEVKKILNDLKKEHKKARHIAYAYKLGNTGSKSDDKEPSGRAGLPLFNILDKNNLDNTLLVVVRYFGGTKLGFGPLSRAYGAAGLKTIKR